MAQIITLPTSNPDVRLIIEPRKAKSTITTQQKNSVSGHYEEVDAEEVPTPILVETLREWFDVSEYQLKKLKPELPLAA